MADGSTVRPLPTRVPGTELGVAKPCRSPSRRCSALVAWRADCPHSRRVAQTAFPQDRCLHVCTRRSISVSQATAFTACASSGSRCAANAKLGSRRPRPA